MERLKSYHRLGESKSKARNMNPTADAIPIIYGHIESSPKAIDVRYPITAPAIRLKAIFFRVLAISSIVGKAYQRRNDASITKDKNQKFLKCITNCYKSY
jgi:hypothetical protein